ncbi:hypothetical protein JKP88DRAFT_241947 [Tribonema minus]|uniref:BACK domain-containing protein n=1 Tax=Tribonema minus TaxID=303371 RepID=A0A835YNG8_9STRA|nr:hypothetical protein JKP88DRAFT_241947 [Tribonema minus]
MSASPAAPAAPVSGVAQAAAEALSEVASLWGQKAYSDVVLTFGPVDAFSESDTNASRKRKRGAASSNAAAMKQGANAASEPEPVPPEVKRLHVHSTILIMHSSVLRSKVISYPGAERPVRIEIKLDDEADVAAFEDVSWGMYHGGKLPAEDMTVGRALAIARLADAYVVNIVLWAAIEWLNQQASLAWDDALRVCHAPVSVRDRLDLGKATTAMLERAGDLEVAMNDEQVRTQLIELPETALVALLSDERLAVAAESTVVALTIKWAQQRRLAKVPDQMANCIRLKHLHSGYLAGVTHFFPRWTADVVALVCVGKHLSSAWQDVRTMLNAPQVLVRASQLERPKSSITAAKFKVVMSLINVAAAFGNAVEKQFIQEVLTSSGTYYGGYCWRLEATVRPDPDASSHYFVDVHILQTVSANSSTGGFVERNIAVACTAKDHAHNKEFSTQKGTAGNLGWGWTDFFEISLAAWDSNVFERCADDAGNLNFEVCAEL